MVRFLAACLGILGAGFLARWLLVRYEGSISGVAPGCTLKSLTGFDCAGCGGTRAMFAFMRGDIAASWRFNPLFLILLAAAGLAVVRWLLLWGFPNRFDRMRRWRFPLWVGFVALGAMMVFMVLRNLPWWPFYLLAPR